MARWFKLRNLTGPGADGLYAVPDAVIAFGVPATAKPGDLFRLDDIRETGADGFVVVTVPPPRFFEPANLVRRRSSSNGLPIYGELDAIPVGGTGTVPARLAEWGVTSGAFEIIE